MRTLVGNADVANDLLQETNHILIKKQTDYRPGSNFSSWAFATAFNVVRTYRKKNQRDRLVFDDNILDDLAHRVQQYDLEAAESHQLLHDCIGKLNNKHQQLLTQRYFREQPLKTISESMGRSTSSLAVTLCRIRVTPNEVHPAQIGRRV